MTQIMSAGRSKHHRSNIARSDEHLHHPALRSLPGGHATFPAVLLKLESRQDLGRIEQTRKRRRSTADKHPTNSALATQAGEGVVSADQRRHVARLAQRQVGDKNAAAVHIDARAFLRRQRRAANWLSIRLLTAERDAPP